MVIDPVLSFRAEHSSGMMKTFAKIVKRSPEISSSSSTSPIGAGILSSFGKSLKQYRQNEKGYEGMEAISSQSFLL